MLLTTGAELIATYIGYTHNSRAIEVVSCILRLAYLARPEVITNQGKGVVWRAKLEAFDRSVLTTSIGEFNIGLTAGFLPYALSGHAAHVHKTAGEPFCAAGKLPTVNTRDGVNENAPGEVVQVNTGTVKSKAGITTSGIMMRP
ncbi:RHS-related protein [Alishewanella jeotgali KCTC 22429]|uniref:RHS-related protein n=1 Tax=Alishewanella jeotgali KCTC 22429 TaxID=1129374 RepID=H3ZEU7_9ALTE|nr:RHS-related protein [Alishewanella jeotgali KCTC 22429]